MKISATTATAVVLAQVAMADFHIYYYINPDPEEGFKFFDKELGDGDCSTIRDADLLKRSGDVSSSTGFRCNSAGACDYNGDPHDVRELELNFGGDGEHITLYRNRDWGLFDTDDNKVGECTPSGDTETVNCGTFDDTIKWFYCKSDLDTGSLEG